MRASVVINTYNRADSLRVTLSALRQHDPVEVEVVVVNGPSTDHTEAVLAEFTGLIKVASCPERNLSMSRNIGIAAAAGDVVVFIDDDAYPDPAWLVELLPAFDDPEVAAAGGPVFDYTGWSLQARYSSATVLGDASESFVGNPTALLNDPFGFRFPYTIGTNAAFRRQRLIDLGGFDEEFEYYLDETDVCCRLVKAGWVVACLERGNVFHKFLPSAVRNPKRATSNRYSLVKNKTYFAHRNGAYWATPEAIEASIAAFIDLHRADVAFHVGAGNLTPADAERYEADVARGVPAGLAAAARPRRIRDAAWFATVGAPYSTFLSFPTALDGQRLHVCILSQEYTPGPLNGVGRLFHTLAAGLAARGHVVRVITRGSGHHRVDLEDGVWVHRMVDHVHAPHPFLEVPPHLWDHTATLADEVDRVHEVRPVDVVIFSNWDVEGLAVMAASRHRTLLTLVTPLATVAAADPRISLADPTVQALLRLDRWSFGAADGFLASSAAIVDEIEDRYGASIDRRRLGLVPYGLPSPPLLDPQDGPSLLFVGRLEPRKGVDTLLAALPLVLGLHPQATVVIAGKDDVVLPDGSTFRSRFEGSAEGRALRDRVHFAGLVDDDELVRLYASCEVFVAPSRFESFGLILLEAMMHAKPVVASDVGGMAAIVEHEGNGFLVPVGEPAALAEALDRLLGDADLRAAMGSRSVQLFRERFSAEAMAAGVEALLLVEVPRRAIEVRSRVIDAVRCPACGGLATFAGVRTESGLPKTGGLSCLVDGTEVAAVDFGRLDFLRTEPPPFAAGLVVPVLGERRIGAADPALRASGSWRRAGHGLLALGGALEALTVDAPCTDALVRLISHPWGGIAELLVDDEVVGEIDLFQAEGSQVVAPVVLRDAPWGTHVVGVRATGRRHPDSKASQVLFEEAVLLGPVGTAGFVPPAPINRGNPYSAAMLRFLHDLRPDQPVLEIGGGDRRSCLPNHLNLEYLPYELADGFADVHHLAFADGTFDAVMTQAVFEHLFQPFDAARELMRVTKPGGLIFTEVAFLQPLHAVPHHYFNMTLPGVKELFPGCDVIEENWFGHLSDTVEWLGRVAGLSEAAPEAMARIVGELRALDPYVSHEKLQGIASGVYLVVRTPEVRS